MLEFLTTYIKNADKRVEIAIHVLYGGVFTVIRKQPNKISLIRFFLWLTYGRVKSAYIS